jgi:hypothetical protein
MFPNFEGTTSMVSRKEREAAAEAERLAALEQADAPVETEIKTDDEPVVETPPEQETPVVPEQAEENGGGLAIQDPASLFEDVSAHIAEDAARKQFPLRLPWLNDIAQFRDKRFKAFGTMWAVQDGEDNWCPDYASLQAYAGVSGEHCNGEGIKKGLAVTLTSGTPTTSSAGKRITIGGGIRPTNEAMILFFGCYEDTVADIVAAGVPHAQLMADLKGKLNRGRDDRKRREANASRSANAQSRQQGRGRRPEVDYKEEEGASGGTNWAI